VRASTLGEETRLVEQAMLAMGEGDRDLARGLLEEHARRFPAGLLERERERALVRLRENGGDGHGDLPH
jgi:phage shock protein A